MNARLTRHAYSNDISNLTIVARVRRDGIPKPRRRSRAPPAGPPPPLEDRDLLLERLQPRAVLVDHLLGRAWRRRPGCRAWRAAPSPRPPSLPSALPSRVRSAAMSITSASGRQKVAPADAQRHRALRRLGRRLEPLDPRQPRHQRPVALQRLAPAPPTSPARPAAPSPRPARASAARTERISSISAITQPISASASASTSSAP